MSTHIGIGFSNAPDPIEAFREAAIVAKNITNQISCDLVLIVATAEYPYHLSCIGIVQKILQPQKIIFTASPGIILSGSIEMRGVGIFALRSDEIRTNVLARGALPPDDIHQSTVKFSRDLIAQAPMSKRVQFLGFFSGLQKNASPLALGFLEGFGRVFPIIGAFCGTRDSSVVALNDTLFPDGMVGVLIGGETVCASEATHGWQPIGRPHIVTEAEDNIIRQIDGLPAVSLYEKYFPDALARTSSRSLGDIGLLYPLGIRLSGAKQYQLLSPVRVLPDQSLLMQASVPPGAKIHLMLGDKDSCRNSAHKAALALKARLGGAVPRAILILESISRRKVLGRTAEREIPLIKEILGLTSPIFGMYTYGEICALDGAGGPSALLPQSASIMMLAIM
ncbi:MAG: hypothetical protein GX606_04220 [Elusimicrobia bacterium]|nr:hypothetical protein [Elusimicrobiota bacterium]